MRRRLVSLYRGFASVVVLAVLAGCSTLQLQTLPVVSLQEELARLDSAIRFSRAQVLSNAYADNARVRFSVSKDAYRANFKAARLQQYKPKMIASLHNGFLHQLALQSDERADHTLRFEVAIEALSVVARKTSLANSTALEIDGKVRLSDDGGLLLEVSHRSAIRFDLNIARFTGDYGDEKVYLSEGRLHELLHAAARRYIQTLLADERLQSALSGRLSHSALAVRHRVSPP